MIETSVSAKNGESRPTKERILDAAERLFAERGFEATSLRMITSAAGVNLAAVNYHFHSKDALIEAAFARRIGPLNQERLRMLEACEAAAGDGPLLLEEIIRALIAPVVRMRQDPASHGVDIGRIIGRVFTDPSAGASRSFFAQMRQVFQPFREAFRRALPEMPRVELLWKIQFCVGVLAHTLLAGSYLRTISGGLCDPSDVEGVLERMVAFIAAGMRAPLPAALDRS